MNKTKTQEQFSAYERRGQPVLAINTEKILPETAPVRLAGAQLEEPDYRKLYEAYSTKGRKSAADAKVMFQIICYGYQCGIYSNRDLEEACRYRVDFMWLLGDEKVPDHCSFSRFRKRNAEAIEDLFYQHVNFPERQGETDHEVKAEGIGLVYGIGKRKSEAQKEYEKLKAYLDRWEKYEKQLNRMGNDRNSYSKTDPDATFMRMKDDHMRNGQLKPGYNVQIAVNSEYITGIEAFPNRTDYGTPEPFLNRLSEKHEKSIKK